MPPIRILQCVNKMDRAGLETMLMNYYRVIDKERIQFDFLTHRSERGAYDDEIEGLGGRVFRAPRLYPNHLPAYSRFMRSLLEASPYTIVHSHIDSMSIFPLRAAKQNAVPVRIAHSHSSSIDQGLKYPIKMILKNAIPNYATDYFACSTQAGEFLFGQNHKFQVLKNAIDLSKFRYSQDARISARKKIGVNAHTKLLCHVGRFAKVKNQEFLVNVLKELRNRGEDTEIAFVGDGTLLHHVENVARDLDIAEYAHFLGERSDVNEILQASDAFVFPSHFEGIPLALIEAQAAGLPVIASDGISSDALISENSYSIPLDVSKWADSIAQLSVNNELRHGDVRRLKKAGYDISENADFLCSFYEQASLR